MNKRIIELAEQAKCHADYYAMLSSEPEQEIFTEKFAELIVEECMACSTWVGKMNTNLVEPVHTAHAINQRIKQQFGVEE
jgi:hypothetical protein